MPTWRDIIESKEYKDLPLGERVKTKNEFFSNIISKSDKFTTLIPEEQVKVRTNFFTPRPEEKLEPFLPEEKSIGNVLRYAIEQFQTKSPFALLDKPVEEIAKFIEPDVAEEGIVGAAKFIPRQMLAEVVRAYKPTTVGTFGLAAKAIKPIAKPVGKAIWKVVPERIKKILLKELTIGKGQPPAYQALTKEAELAKVSGAREAEQVAKTLTTKPSGEALTGEEQRYMGRIFRKEVIESPALRAHPKYQELKTIADEGRVIMDKWSTELAKSGIPKEQTKRVIEENIGSYMARMYATKLTPKEVGGGFFKQMRLRLGMLKHRKDLSEQVRNLMGEIKEPALPTAIRVREISANVANNKLFNKVVQNPEWVSNEAIQGWVKMPDALSVGPLKGKWVIPEIGEDINAIVNIGKQSQGIYLKLLSAWKFGKVVLNPATQVRNAISNTMLLDISGTNHIRQVQLFPKAFNELLSKGKIYQQALEDGAVGGEFIGGEIKRLRDFYIGGRGNNLQRWLDIAKFPFQKAADLYQGMEQSAKLVKYMDVLEKGGSRKLAAEEAQKWLFDYTKVPKIVDFIRKSPIGAPFATFCVSADTQILTDKGWKFFDEIEDEDKTLAYQIETNQLEWQKIKKVNVFPYNRKMLHIKSRCLDILMTPEHRNIVLHRNKKSYIRKIKLAKDLNSRDSIIVTGEYIAPITKVVDDDIVRLVGWFITEGYLINTTNAFCIGQTNMQGQKEIEDLRKRLKVDKYNVQLRHFKSGGYKLHKVYYFPAKIRDEILKLAPNKKLTTEFLRRLTKEQLQILYNVLLLADGHNPKLSTSNQVLIQNPGKTADNMQILGVMLGKQFGWSIKENCLAITVTKGKVRQLKRNLPKQVDYQGLVWCPQTDYGAWVARRNGKVFITGNSYKALPRLAETLVNKPLTLYKYYALANAFNETSRKYQGMLPTEYARQKKLLPEWVLRDIGGMPTNLLLPNKDKYGRTQWLNLEYILPIGQAPEIMEKGLLKGGISNPVFNIIADLIKNSDFRGKPIVPQGATKWEAAQARFSHIYRQLAPGLAPSIPPITKGGYSFEKIMDAIAKRPDFAERTRDLTPVLLDTLAGFKITPLDVNEADKFRLINKKKIIDDLKTQVLRLQHPAISEKERNKKTEEIFKKIQKEVDDL